MPIKESNFEIRADTLPGTIPMMDVGDSTGTINLARLFEEDLTTSGSFDLRGIRATSFGRLLQALPIPVFLIDLSCKIAFANNACRKIAPRVQKFEGSQFASLFPHETGAMAAQLLLDRAVVTSQLQVTEALLEMDGNKIWGRIYLRSVRTGKDKSILLVVEDLSLEKKQALLSKRHREELLRANKQLMQEVEQRRSAERDLQRSVGQLENVLEQAVSALASAAEKRDPYIAGHQTRVAKLAGAIGAEMGMPEARIRGICVSGTLHDIGKLCVPAEILSKAGQLTELEFAMIKTHARAGYDILKGIEFSWPIADIVAQHHERMDGSWYPHGLNGEAILVEARILAVADVVEAMSSHRPYRPAVGIEPALAEIRANSAILYDCEVVDACFSLVEKGYTPSFS